MSLEPILPEVAAGSPGAVSACIGRYGNLLWTVARRMLPTAAEAEDAVQEIFVELWRCAPGFSPHRGSESVFVMTLARRRLIDRLRRAGRRPREVRLEEAPVRSSEAALERGLDAARTAVLLESLPAERRRVLRLCVVEGWSHAEAARITGLPLGTVKSHVQRGLAQVRRALTNREGVAS
ncbi:MAG: sigma-70 family RNA polymerase sigma factor [Deltaproteobacteria bacterium]|nr:sigma-70 family RNA polymerase sigma factor [Deltaproteobacteria bacterium]